MAQDSLSVQNGTGVAVRQAFNTAMQASATNQSGSSAPSTTYPFQFYVNTSTNTLQIRNAANNAYINVSGVGQVGAANLGLLAASGGTISGNLIVSGDLTVNGSTTTIDTTTLTVEDKNIELGKVSTPTDTTADGGGITLKGATDKTFNWIDATDSWTSSEHIAIEGNTKRLFIKDTAGTGNAARPGLFMQDSAASNQFFIGNGSSTDTDLSFVNYTNANIQFRTNNTERLKITSDGNIQIPDDKYLQFGGSQELSIRVDESSGTRHSYMFHTGNGAFKLGSNSTFYIGKTTNETYIECNPDGNVELYYDNVKRLETTSVGANITGNLGLGVASPTNRIDISEAGNQQIKIIRTDGVGSGGNGFIFKAGSDASSIFTTGGEHQIKLYTNSTERLILKNDGKVQIPNDTGKLQFGTGQDLEIYHDGSQSYIKNITGYTVFESVVGVFIKTNNEHAIDALQDGAVNLYYDASKKLETTSTGISVTGGGTFTAPVNHNYTSAVNLPVGTTAQRPASPATGDFRFNSTTTQAEIYDGSAFTAVGGGGGATGGGGEKIFHESENEMNSSYTISSNHNALVAGPLTIASGATLTVNSPSVVTIP